MSVASEVKLARVTRTLTGSIDLQLSIDCSHLDPRIGTIVIPLSQVPEDLPNTPEFMEFTQKLPEDLYDLLRRITTKKQKIDTRETR